MKRLFLLFVFLNVYSQSKQGLAGSLDTTFGDGGLFIEQIPNYSQFQFNAIAIDSLYRLLVTGQVVGGDEGSHIITARLLPNGLLDQSFAGIGYTLSDPLGLPYDNNGTSGISIVVDSLNRTIVLGLEQEGGGRFSYSLNRYLPDGLLDSSFGTDGIVIETNLEGANFGYLNQIIIDSQNRILGTGVINTGVGNNGILVVRHNVDGSLDTSFGDGNGYVIVRIDGDGDDQGKTLCLDNLGNIYVGSDSSLQHSGIPISCVIALDSSGNLLTSFATGGIYTNNFSDGYDSLQAIICDSQERVVVGCSFYNPSEFGLFRLSSEGLLDTTFGDNGFAAYSYSSNNNLIGAIALDSYQRIIAMGSADNDNFFLVMRTLQDGQIDTSFDQLGFNETAIYNHSYGAFGLLSPQGRIVMCGSTGDNEGNSYFAAIAYTIGYNFSYYQVQFAGQPLGLL